MDEVKVGSGWTPVPAAHEPVGLEACRHCRQPILHAGLRNGQGENFCCQGCLQVHGILGGNQWDRYYDLLEQGGRKAPKAVVGEEYAAFLSGLEDARILAGIGKWEDGRHSVTAAIFWMKTRAGWKGGKAGTAIASVTVQGAPQTSTTSSSSLLLVWL